MILSKAGSFGALYLVVQLIVVCCLKMTVDLSLIEMVLSQTNKQTAH
jgi:hypothetical protein